MATKTISIMQDAYNLLLRNKMRNESFSDAIRRILTKNDNILEFAGAWREIEDKEVKEMKKAIANLRKHSTQELRAG
ncbi:MAG: antitoxin VapB family protein [Nanoarchaeota archaeon]|nr:antitoxin VapB family protein [Nanoarchaeota archaeon]MBU0978125.1 antitoxin VapB family protein [Nanoarchaeota archaeon]